MAGPNLFVQRTASQFQGRLLGQSANTATAPFDLYTLSDGVSTAVRKVYICNTTASAATYRLHHAESGETASTSNALFYDRTITGRETHIWEFDVFMNTNGAILKAQCGTTAACTFTAYGEEIQTRAR